MLSMKASKTRFRSSTGVGTARLSSTSVGPDRSVPLMDGLVSDTIDALQDMSEHYTRRIEIERRRSDDLDKKLTVLRAKLVDTRRVTAGVDDITVQRRQQAKLKTIENRLQKMLEKENQAESETRRLRERIEGLRRERMQHERIRKQLERETRGRKRALVDLLQATREATDTRDRFQREVQVLQATIQQEVSEFEIEFTDRVAELQSAKPLTLMEIDRSAPVGPDEAARLHFGSATAHAGSMTIEQEMSLKHKSIKSYWDVAKREVDLRRQSRLLAKYDDAFEKIRAETGIQTIDEMTSEFVSAEEHNFSLINMINDLTREIEALEVENAKVRAQVMAAKAKGEMSGETRKKMFEGMEAQETQADRKAELFNKNYEETLKSMSGLKASIISIFQKVGCADESTAERLLATGVTESSIMTFLGLIEQRISEICQMVAMSKAGRPLTKPSASSHDESGGLTASAGAGAGTGASGETRFGMSASAADISSPGLGGDSIWALPHSTSHRAIGVGGAAAPRAVRPIQPTSLLALADEDSDSDDDGTSSGVAVPISLNDLKSHTAAKLQRKKAKMDRRLHGGGSVHEDPYDSYSAEFEDEKSHE